jgi:hypothetical protein
MADARDFTIVTTCEDPLIAEELVELLREEKIDAFSRARGAASSASFEAVEPGFWEVFVPKNEVEKATKVWAELEAEVEKDAVANAAAAEEESMSGETKLPD